MRHCFSVGLSPFDHRVLHTSSSFPTAAGCMRVLLAGCAGVRGEPEPVGLHSTPALH